MFKNIFSKAKNYYDEYKRKKKKNTKSIAIASN